MKLYMWQLWSAGRDQDASNGLQGSVQRYKYYCTEVLSARCRVYITYGPRGTQCGRGSRSDTNHGGAFSVMPPSAQYENVIFCF
jgi:hypothetical protein